MQHLFKYLSQQEWTLLNKLNYFNINTVNESYFLIFLKSILGGY